MLPWDYIQFRVTSVKVAYLLLPLVIWAEIFTWLQVKATLNL